MLYYCHQLNVDNYSHIVLCQQNEKYIAREYKSLIQLEKHLNINQTVFSWDLSNAVHVACLLFLCQGVQVGQC